MTAAPPIDYPQTWYRDTRADDHSWPGVKAPLECDVCIIGAGLAGLSCAIELAAQGKNTIVLEASRVAWGASGRNAGFVIAGYAHDIANIERRIGPDAARELYRLSREGVELVRQRVAELAPQALLGSGSLCAGHTDDEPGVRRSSEYLARQYDHHVKVLSEIELAELLRSPAYFQATLDAEAFHIHPLNFARALARHASALGVRIFEQSPARHMNRASTGIEVVSNGHTIRAEQVVMATSAYDRNLYNPLARAIVPVATYIAGTEPLGERIRTAIRTDAAIYDYRSTANYYRVVEGDRILWGGRITTRTREPTRLARLLHGDMTGVYPQLADVRMEYAWSGLVAYCRHFMPIIGRIEPGIWATTGFGGHGLNTTAIAGRLIARAIACEDDEWQRFSAYGPVWAGGPFGRVATQVTYWFMQARDRLQEIRHRRTNMNA
jgi:gamma-glutamylputrescine oxidase